MRKRKSSTSSYGYGSQKRSKMNRKPYTRTYRTTRVAGKRAGGYTPWYNNVAKSHRGQPALQVVVRGKITTCTSKDQPGGNAYVFNCNWLNFAQANDALLHTAIAAYANSFAEFRVKSVTFEYWLNDNDEVSKADSVQMHSYATYDDAQYSRFLNAAYYAQWANVEHTILSPGVIYRKKLVPKYAEATDDEVYVVSARPMGEDGWFFSTDFDKDMQSVNGYHMVYQGPEEPASVRLQQVYELEFRGMKNSAQYSSTVTKKFNKDPDAPATILADIPEESIPMREILQ